MNVVEDNKSDNEVNIGLSGLWWRRLATQLETSASGVQNTFIVALKRWNSFVNFNSTSVAFSVLFLV